MFDAPSPVVARTLIGAALTVGGVGGLIVETEAYADDDPASHAFNGPTARNAVMFGPPGRAYVYRSYGLHWCLNIVCGPAPGSAVLLRALEPRWGLEAMRERRGGLADRLLCAGPGRLCQALDITIAQNGLPMDQPPFELSWPEEPAEIVEGPRIGLTKAVETPWRFGLAGSKFLSRPFPGAPPP
jgi:DNA-3-methyladenine glycosylase